MIETSLDDNSFHQKSVPLDAEYVRNLEQENVTLRHEISNLKRLIFGSKSESFIAQNTPAKQLSLDIQAEAIATCSVTKAQKIEYTRQQLEIKKDHPGRTKLPEHLERREIIIEPLQKTEGCKKIGDEVTEELEYEPGKLFVNRYVRPKYVTGDNSAINHRTYD